MLWLLSGLSEFTCWISFAPFFSFIYLWVLIFALSLFFISWLTCSRRWCIDKFGVFHANQTSMCLDPQRCETGFKPSSKIILLTIPRWYFFCGSFMLFLSCVCFAFARACLLMSCGHLLEKGWPLCTRLWCLIVSALLSHRYPVSGVVFDLSIPDLCPLSYFATSKMHLSIQVA